MQLNGRIAGHKECMLRRRNTPEPVARPVNCLNCGVAVPPESVYCGQCGQENETSPVSFAALMREVWEEFVKVDAKLLKTLALLVGRPGHLTTEFVKGRRTAYLSPFRMYIGVSALFFFVFGILVPFDRVNGWDEKVSEIERQTEIAIKEKKKKGLIRQGNSKNNNFSVSITSGGDKDSDFLSNWKEFRSAPLQILGYRVSLQELPETVSQYRDQQRRLAQADRSTRRGKKLPLPDSPARHYVTERMIHFKNEPADTAKSLFSTAFPLMLLVQLPLAAIWLRILYFRQKKLYVEHLVFLLHTHTLYLLLLGLVLAPEAVMLSMGAHWAFFEKPQLWLGLAIIIGWHNLIAMRRFYGQGWGKTLVKSWFFGHGYLTLLAFTLAISVATAVLWTMLVPG